ncbi:MAG: cell division protein FtsL [Candidatus Cloacimonetes bacterium]|nr:cell division protein FtsL [Candidatus Cloacimonadota bacterium]MCF7814117.1 cell division protein FtsL [Candidatus Cloacimonadota bacterium]MCF7868734.1 cell division protein FtsL [Candidatus Cloacimonadota bacterium]MCF7884116.1 cell division protein FtsL [Candidatus Cloacimonadota bacterium]
MKIRLLILVVLILTSVFVHYQNQHKIMSYSREINEINETLKSAKDINLDLVTYNSTLGSRERIQKLAYEQLGMCYPSDATEVHNIVMNSDDETFCLVDFIVPSAEALTK